MSDSSSTKSTTPKTENRGDFVEKPHEEQLPEAAKQPLLDPANQRRNGKGLGSPHDQSIRQSIPQDRGRDAMKETLAETGSDGRRSSRPSSGRQRVKSDLGHMVEVKAYYDDTRIDGQRSSRPSSGRRKVKSDLGPMMGDQASYDRGRYGYPFPYGSYQPAGMAYPHQTRSSRSPSFQGFVDPQSRPPPSRRRPSHQRVHSLPQAPSDMWPYGMMSYPPPGVSPFGYPPDAILPDESGPLLPYSKTSPTASYRKRKSHVARAPAPVMMPMPLGAARGMYGSIDNRSYEELTPPPPPQGAPSHASPYIRPENFSPRGEIKKLTSGFVPNRGTPPPSPSIRKTGMDIPPYSRSPRPSPPGSSSLRSPGYYMRGDDARVSWTPDTPLQDGYDAMSSVRGPYLMSPHNGVDFSSEGSYRDTRRGKPHSRRKMHMRQKSAQLFMEDTKGVKQPLACKDVLFYLLFVVHLIGVLYLGAHYSRDALMVNKTGDEWTVNVDYRNVIFVAAFCGAFAVTLSTLTLILMTVIVRRLVQVSLILAIALSFAWGTIGIGVSPKPVVPITGFIALALSVGYTFVVWDRIPFASANLHAGLTGVRRNAGTVLVALFFQFLALVWSIYYTFVVVGVYDALLEGDLKLSKNATVFVYTMLFISYFWTYNVLLVSVYVHILITIASWWLTAFYFSLSMLYKLL